MHRAKGFGRDRERGWRGTKRGKWVGRSRFESWGGGGRGGGGDERRCGR